MTTLFVFNFFINSFLVFATSWIAIEAVFFILRVKDYRLKYYASCLPLLKVFIDIFNYGFNNWALCKSINPMLCEQGTRVLTIEIGLFKSIGVALFKHLPSFNIWFHLEKELTFTLSDLVALSIGNFMTTFIATILALISAIGIVRFAIRFKKTKSLYKNTVKDSSPIHLEFIDLFLKEKNLKKEILIKKSSLVKTPCTFRFEKKMDGLFFLKISKTSYHKKKLQQFLHMNLSIFFGMIIFS